MIFINLFSTKILHSFEKYVLKEWYYNVFPKATVYVADNLFILMLKYSSFYAYTTPNITCTFIYTSKSFSQL